MLIESREEFLLRVDPIIVKQSHKQHKGSEILEVDDIMQEVRLNFLMKYEHLKGLADDALSYVAYRAAAAYCQQERTDYMYASGNFVYSGGMVEYLLKDHAFTDLDGDTDVEGRVDIHAAVNALTKTERAAILKRYRDGEPLARGAESVAASRGLRSMTDYLNRGANKSRVELNVASGVI